MGKKNMNIIKLLLINISMFFIGASCSFSFESNLNQNFATIKDLNNINDVLKTVLNNACDTDALGIIKKNTNVYSFTEYFEIIERRKNVINKLTFAFNIAFDVLKSYIDGKKISEEKINLSCNYNYPKILNALSGLSEIKEDSYIFLYNAHNKVFEEAKNAQISHKKLNVSFLITSRDVKYKCLVEEFKKNIDVEENSIYWNKLIENYSYEYLSFFNIFICALNQSQFK